MANKRITDVDYLESLNSDESFFINQNNTLKQINKSNVVFDVVNGGTGATTAEEALANLGAASKTEVDEMIDVVNNEVKTEITTIKNSLGTQVTYSLEGTVLTITTK